MKLVKGIIATAVALCLVVTNAVNATNKVTGDYNGDGNQDAFNQAINKGETSSLTPESGSTISGFHRSWTAAHPDISQITDWTAENYGAFSSNLNSSPGDELLLLGKKKIILLHGDIITPILLPKDVQNAIISWSASGVASYTSFDMDADPDQFNVLFGDFDGDGYQEIMLQGKSLGSTSYILNGDGSISQTLANGFEGMDWSGASYSLVVQDINGDGIDDIKAFSNVAGQGNQFVYMAGSKVDYVDVGFNQTENPATASLVGSTGGQFRVDESGAATYSIPIAVPAGTAGVAPQLSLNYSSNAGNGPLGIGWSLSGMSAISRCGKNIAQNGNEISGITNTSADRFCMDGQQLFSLNDLNYGGNGTSYNTETFNNTDITSHGGTIAAGPTEWRIKTRAGDTHYYGQVSGSSNALIKTEDNTVNRLWLLRKTEDLAGNTITYNYGKASDNSEAYIKDITYGGNVNVPTSDHSKVQFVYADEIDVNFVRPDQSKGFAAGSTVAQTKLLKQIRTYNGSNHVRTTQLFHEASNAGLSRIKAIQECSYLNNCLAPIQFDWTDVNLGYSSTRSYADGATRLDEDFMLTSDIDGDGMSDIIYLDDWGDKNGDRDIYIRFSPYMTAVNSTYKMSAQEFASIRLIDFNSDGVMDLIYEKEIAAQDKLAVVRWNESSQQLVGSILGISVNTDDEMTIVDLDGDAKMDLLRVENDKVYWYRHTAFTSQQSCIDYGGCIGQICTTVHSFTAAPVEVTVDIPSLTIEGGILPFNPSLVGISKWVDLNGDGISDLISKVKKRYGDDPGRYTYGYSYYGLIFNPATNTFSSFDEIIGDYPGFPNIYPMDVNSDGLTDVVYAHGVGANWRYKLSKGGTAGFSDSYDTGIASASIASGDNNRNMVLDYDQDGTADFFVFKETALGNGSYDIYTFKNGTTVNLGLLQGKIKDEPRLVFGNFQAGNPGTEMLSYNDSDGWYKIYSTLENVATPNFSTRPNVIRTITGSTGVNNEITYSALSDENIYTKTIDPAVDFPTLQLTPFQHVVKQVVSETGALDSSNNEETVSVSYKYEDFRAHTQGRGQLGFKKLISIDDQTGIQTITEYEQGFPFVGMPKSTTRKLSDGTILSTAINDWKTKTYFSRLFPYLDNSVEKTWSLDSDGTPDDLNDNPVRFINQVITTNVYESNGNNYGNILTTSVLNTTSEAAGGAGGSEWFQTSTTNNYGTSTYEKKYARLKNVTVTKSRSDVSGLHTQTSEFEYYPESYSHNGSIADGYPGMLKKEFIFKGSDKEVNKTHQFDEFGNKTVEIVEAKLRDSTTLAFAALSQRTTQTTYTTDGRFIDNVVNDLGFEKTFTYDPRFNGVSTETGANGLTVTYDYDELGVKYHTQAADGTYSRDYLYLCGIGGATCPTDGEYYSESRAYASDGSNLSGYSRTYFNKMGQEIVKEGQTFGDKKLISRTEYDKYGRVSKGYLPVFGNVNTVGADFTEATYDALGRLIGQTEPGNRITTRQYEGTTTININAIGQTTTETKNINGELGKVKDNNNKEMTYLYDTRGNFVKLIDSASNTVEMIYDTVGHKIETRDPDKGNWQYKFNGFGELVQQIDARGVVITQDYDLLGRMVKRVDNANVSGSTPVSGIEAQTTCWTYDTAAFGTTGTLLKGQLHKVRLFAGEIDCGSTTGLIPLQEKITGFDNLGRAESATQKIKSESSNQVDTYLTMSTFEATSSRVLFTILPREVTVKNHYDDFGNLTKITDAVDETILYREVTDIDKFGNVSNETYGNGISAIKVYNPQTGYLESVTAGNIIGNETVDFTQYFDGIGNVTQRSDNVASLYERFGYAEGGSINLLNRITSYDTSNDPKDTTVVICKTGPCDPIQNYSNQKTYSYDALGNLKSKSDMGDDYIYGAGSAGVHALTSIKSGGNLLRTFGYDTNGNMTSDIDSVNSNSNRTIQYGAFEKPVSIQKGSSNASQITFRYGSSRERYRRIDNVYEGSTAVSIETTYLGGYEKVVHSGGAKDGTTEHKYMLGGVALKIDTEKTGQATTTKTRYLHKDHLGSVVAITDEAGTEKARFRYDPFGKQYSVANQSAISQTPVTAWLEDTQRGFTGHEMLSSVDIIHMNGRIYDANIGRFMQADAYIQAPKNMQSMNRYSYVLNNPLSYTDPSGHFFKSLKKYWRSIAAIALNIALCGGGCGFWGTVGAGAASGAVATGSLKGALTGAFSAAVFFGIGEAFEGARLANNASEAGLNQGFELLKEGHIAEGLKAFNDSKVLTFAQQAGKVASHAVAGGVMSKLNGGKFGHGFVSAGVTQAFSKTIRGISSSGGKRIAAAAVLGGVTSAATGGKFANGAVTAAFSRAFNDEHLESEDDRGPVGISFGVSWNGPLWLPYRGAFSGTFLIDPDSLELAFVPADEHGAGVAAPGVAGDLSVNLVWSDDGMSLDDFGGNSINVSGSFNTPYYGLGLNGSWNTPSSYAYGEEINGMRKANGVNLGGNIYEAGIAIGNPGVDLGVTIGDASVYKWDILTRTRDYFNGD